MYTTGRDGSYYQLFVQGRAAPASAKAKALSGDELGGWGPAMVAGGSMVILGFHANEFVVWSPGRGSCMSSIVVEGTAPGPSLTLGDAMAFAYLKDGV